MPINERTIRFDIDRRMMPLSKGTIMFDIDFGNLEKAIRWTNRINAALKEKCCVICGIRGGEYLLTCSEKCHNRLMKEYIEDFGPYKDITDAETGKTHRVPTEVIFEHGIGQQDLKNYPVAEKDQ